MKGTTLLITLLFSAIVSFGQTDIVLNIDHVLNGSSFSFSQTAQAPDGYDFEVDRLQYYLSGFSITHDGGQVTSLDSAVALVNAGNTDQYDLGNFNIMEVEALSFYIGVGPDENHEDPALWPNGHPLAPVFPSMHWGWSAGYRFVAMEGEADGQFGYELHSLGDNNYYQASMNMSASAISGTLVLELTGDYSKVLTDVDVSGGLIDHSQSSPTAAQVLQNMANLVFVPTAQVGIEETFDGKFILGPNPSAGEITVDCEFLKQGTYELIVVDQTGRTIERKDLSGSGKFLITDLPVGILSFVLKHEGKIVANRQVVVAK